MDVGYPSSDEFVETSDVEELEELEDLKRTSPSESANGRIEDTPSRPRKRIKLAHDDEHTNRAPRTPTLALREVVAETPHRSQSSGTVFMDNTTSPTRIGDSPTKTSDTSKIGMDVGRDTKLFEISQNPLLLPSPLRNSSTSLTPVRLGRNLDMTGNISCLPQSTTPLGSPPTARMQPLMSSFKPLASLSSPVVLSTNQSQTVESEDTLVSSPSTRQQPFPAHSPDVEQPLLPHINLSQPLETASHDINMLFSSPERPSERPMSSQVSIPSDSAPASPDVSSTGSRSMVLPGSPSPPPSPMSEIPRSPEPDPLPEQPQPQPQPEPVEQPEVAHFSRYPRRERQPQQLRPYTADGIAYRLALRAVPEAIVNISTRGRGESKAGADKESQDAEFLADNEEDDDELRRESEREKRELNRILNAINGEEEDEGERRKRRAEEKEKKMAKRERKRQEKERRKEEKEQKRKEREQRAAIRMKTAVAGSSNIIKENPVNTSSKNQEKHSIADAIMSLYAHDLSDDDPPSPPRLNAEVEPFEDAVDHYAQDLPSDTYESPAPHRPTVKHRNGSHAIPDTISIHSDPDEHERGKSPSPALSNPSDSGSDSDNSSGPDALARLDERKKDILCKMYPAGLAKKLLESNRRPLPKKSRRAVSSDVDDNAPLMPGQTRVHRAARGPELKEIKGDSESELEMSETEQRPTTLPNWPRLPSSPFGRLTPLRPTKPDRQDGMKPAKRQVKLGRTFYESASDSELEIIDDSAIAQITERSSKGTSSKADNPRAEVTLIDYMLQRTRVFGHGSHTTSRSKNRSGKKRQKQQKFKHDIVTSGARAHGKGRQTLISNFNGYGNDLKGGKKTQRRLANEAKLFAPRSSEPIRLYDTDSDSDDSSEGDDEDGNTQHRVAPVEPQDSRKREKRKKEKERKARIRAQGLYIIKPKGGTARIVAGLGRGHYQDAPNLEKEVPGHRLAHPQPKIRQWEGPIHRRVRSPDTMSPLEISNVDFPGKRNPSQVPEPITIDLRAFPDADVDDSTEATPIQKDSGIPLLPSGIAFNPDTYVRKGWLHELIFAIHPPSEPLVLMPIRVHLQAYQVRPDFSSDDLCQLVEKVFEDAFDFVDKPPSPDQPQQVDDWSYIIHHIGQGISSHLPKLDDAERSKVVDAVGTAAIRLGVRIDGLDLRTSDVLDLPVFQARWLAVEVCARIGGRIPNNRGVLASSPLTDSIQSLIKQLFLFGLDKTMKPVLSHLEDNALAEPTVASFTVELWTRLIHLLLEYDKEGQERKRVPILWQFFLAPLKSSSEHHDAAFYEDLWQTTFCLCALSQFSAIGMTLGKVTLPACWDVITYICDGTFRNLSTSSPIGDSYVRYILARCFLLTERWGWKANNISALVKLFVDKIFAPRKFANLEEEKPEFPEFLRDPQQDDIATFNPKDSAYALLLKFIFKASTEESVNQFTIKKLISLSEPVSAVQFKREMHPEIGELSMVMNRISAAIIGVRLNPAAYESKVNQVRNCVSFAQSNSQTRYTLLRGLQYWALFIIRHEPNLSLEKLAPWLGDMATCLADEWKKNHGGELVHRKLLAKSLLHVVYKIIYVSPGAPESTFLATLKPLYNVARDDAEIQGYVRKIMVLIINRWYETVPPERPPLPKEPTEEESQDAFGDQFSDIDWGAGDLPPELAVDTPHKPDPAPLKQTLTDTNMGWVAFRCAKECIINGHVYDARVFLSCWVGCRLLLLKPQVSIEDELLELTRSVDIMFKEEGAGPRPERLRKIADVLLCISLLERYPMVYTLQAFTPKFLQNFLRSLLCVDNGEIDIHIEFVASLLSVDYLQHPLLRGCSCLPPLGPQSILYHFTRQQFLEFRLGILETILSNLDNLILEHKPEADKFTTDLISALSSMRNNIVNPNHQQDDRTLYATFCGEVKERLKKAQNLADKPGMLFWKAWTP